MNADERAALREHLNGYGGPTLDNHTAFRLLDALDEALDDLAARDLRPPSTAQSTRPRTTVGVTPPPPAPASAPVDVPPTRDTKATATAG